MSDFPAPPELLAAFTDADSTVRLHASSALARSHDPKAIDALIAAMPADRLAVDALGESRSPRAVSPLIAFVQNAANKTEDRAAAATSLGKLGDPRAVEPLIASLNEDNGAITMQASSALGYLKDKRAVEPLKQAYARWNSRPYENAGSVTVFILAALQQLGSTELMRRVTGSPVK